MVRCASVRSLDTEALAAIRAVVSAAREGSEERAERLARIEAMLGASALAARAEA